LKNIWLPISTAQASAMIQKVSYFPDGKLGRGFVVGMNRDGSKLLLRITDGSGAGYRYYLRDVAAKYGTPSYMVDHAGELDSAWLEGKQRIGLTAGASAPDILVQQVISRLRELGATSVRTLDGVQETVKFPLPKGLRND
jgi:hypothetical protein